VIAHHLWVKMGYPARVRLYSEDADLIIIPGAGEVGFIMAGIKRLADAKKRNKDIYT